MPVRKVAPNGLERELEANKTKLVLVYVRKKREGV
jgi:hypothetical protein